MRTTLSLGFATMLVLLAVGSWAATRGSQAQPQLSALQIAPLELMMSAEELPVRQYDAN
jgi:hypothetical protein